ncbi:L-lactate dehydrogenase [Rhodopirellula sp. SWK7]|uniref:L-lactate dehydrogenase n=1 Tax=Rhodopirellula sp. SWK7 TaxID=595460 RepID=UPI0002BFD9B3|nr:L-lactate dehydrogenase [Rhodopirellula sp. SWK7]EMI47036.1 L-lactate dehydrogenase 2 [Rhodopirellula sp. SWK7]
MKVGIVGSGFVGSTAAYALVMQGIGREIVMVDKNDARAAAEADDIFHAVPFAHPLTIRSGQYADLANSRVVIVAAGTNQRPGETRLQLLQRNAEIFRELVPKIIEHAPDAILLIATNPVDIMTHLAGQFAISCGTAVSRVIGSGTMLDTARFRTLLGGHFGVDSQHVHGYVIGEHGDSEVLTWSHVSIAGLSLKEFGNVRGVELDDDTRAKIDDQVRRAAYRIIEGKGATYYGIGSALARIVDVILHDQRSILTICSRIENMEGLPDVTISMPHLLGGDGVIAPIPLDLANAELLALMRSAEIISGAIDSIAVGTI